MSGLVSGAASSTWMKRMLGLSYARPLKETEGPQAELRGAGAIKAVGSWQAGGGLRLDSDARGFWLLYDLLTGHLRLCVLGDAAGEASCTSHLPCISPISPLYLPYTSTIPPYISRISPRRGLLHVARHGSGASPSRLTWLG